MPPKKRKAPATESLGRFNKRSQKTASVTRRKSASAKPFRFLDLPPELRQKVYEAFFELRIPRHHCNKKCPSDCSRDDDATSLQYVSRQIRLETWSLFTDYHTFRIVDAFSMLEEFIFSVANEDRSSIKHLTIVEDKRERESDIMWLLSEMWFACVSLFLNLETLTFETCPKNIRAPFQPISVSKFIKYSDLFDTFIRFMDLNVVVYDQELPLVHDFEVCLVQKQNYSKRENWPKNKWSVTTSQQYILRQNNNPMYTNATQDFEKWRKEKVTSDRWPWCTASYDPREYFLGNMAVSDTESFNYLQCLEDAQYFLNERVDKLIKTEVEAGRCEGCIIEGIGIVGRKHWLFKEQKKAAISPQ